MSLPTIKRHVEDEDEYIEIVDLRTPAPPNQLTTIDMDTLLDLDFNTAWCSAPDVQNQPALSNDDWMSASLEARMLEAAEASENQKSSHKNKAITVLHDVTLNSTSLEHSDLMQKSPICSPANGEQLRKILDMPSKSSAGMQEPPTKKTKNSISVKKRQKKQQPQTKNNEETQVLPHIPHSQKWLEDFDDVRHREWMRNVDTLWKSLKETDNEYQRDIGKYMKNMATFEGDIKKEREIVQAAEKRIAKKNEEKVKLQLSLQQLQRRQESCRLQLQHFRKFAE